MLIHERRDDDRVAHHVVRLDPLVDVHVRVVRPRVVLDRILDELKARQPDRVERQVIGAAGVADRQRRHPEVLERLHPAWKIGATASLPCR